MTSLELFILSMISCESFQLEDFIYKSAKYQCQRNEGLFFLSGDKCRYSPRYNRLVEDCACIVHYQCYTDLRFQSI